MLCADSTWKAHNSQYIEKAQRNIIISSQRHIFTKVKCAPCYVLKHLAKTLSKISSKKSFTLTNIHNTNKFAIFFQLEPLIMQGESSFVYCLPSSIHIHLSFNFQLLLSADRSKKISHVQTLVRAYTELRTPVPNPCHSDVPIAKTPGLSHVLPRGSKGKVIIILYAAVKSLKFLNKFLHDQYISQSYLQNVLWNTLGATSMLKQAFLHKQQASLIFMNEWSCH